MILLMEIKLRYLDTNSKSSYNISVMEGVVNFEQNEVNNKK